MRRKVSATRKSSLNPNDALELFLDALCNTLGVIMFIMLLVVVFAKPPEQTSPQQADSVRKEAERLAREAIELERQATETARAIALLPPAGDADLIARWKVAVERMSELQATRVVRLEEMEESRRKLLVATEALAAVEETRKLKEVALQQVKVRLDNLPPSTSFVRVSRFQADPKGRKPVLLLISGGRLTRPTVGTTTESVVPKPGDGRLIIDALSADVAFKALVPGADPAVIRLNIGVWEDSFDQYKRLESLLTDLGYAVNPLPVATGGVLRKGSGGIQ